MPKDKDHKGEDPRPGDDPQTALEKSGSMDERAPDAGSRRLTTDEMIVGAPGTYLPGMGTGTGAGSRAGEELGEGERALEVERKPQRSEADKQRG